MGGEPHDRDARRVEDVVDLSPKAVAAQVTDRPVEPAGSTDTLRNPPAQRQEQDLRDAEARLEKAREADIGARVEAADVGPNGPINIGLAAAIAVGLPDLVDRFDINGDDSLDQRERERAIRSVQSEAAYDQVRGGGPLTPEGEVPESGAGEGAEAYAELQARKAEASQQRAEEQEKAARAKAERVAELAEQAQGVTPQAAASDDAYARSEELGLIPGAVRSVSA
ncbi:hypothetical protein [Roseospira visakhapatnamensis]|nr:hypothetical protein [Roseospira visakhapatnamensis]